PPEMARLPAPSLAAASELSVADTMTASAPVAPAWTLLPLTIVAAMVSVIVLYDAAPEPAAAPATRPPLTAMATPKAVDLMVAWALALTHAGPSASTCALLMVAVMLLVMELVE